MKTSGGFLLSKQDLVRHSYHLHTAALDNPVSAYDMEALNRAQSTPYRISAYVLSVMEDARTQKIALPGMAEATMRCPPNWPDYATWKEHLRTGGHTLSDDVWAGMDKAGRTEFLSGVAEVHDHNSAAEGRLWALNDLVSVAQSLRSEPRVFYVHTRCFRGRIHPAVTGGPNPQGSDMSKSLLEFATGLPLGAEGKFWLMVRAAGLAGQDKLPFEQRAQWTAEHCLEIMGAAEDPLHDPWWQQMDDPWCFLATCRELASMWSMDDGTQFVSHLPVPLDGSCNGLQHLGAMSLDADVCHGTNLTADSTRQDLYASVAAIVSQLVEKDAADGIAEAHFWYGKVTRKEVKRAVMTTPYGVTERGIRTQLINDGFLDGVERADRGRAADYLRDKIVAALDTKIGRARAIMAWLQTVSRRLANAGLPFRWRTPTGSEVLQAYRATVEERILTLVGRSTLLNEHPDGGYSGQKQASGAAPNFVHSFDASHLAMVVNTAWEEGIRSLALIHDSYGTHARNTGQLARVLRETFVSIYSQDWLAQTADYVRSYAPHVELPALPERGGFDIQEVLSAPFFFS